MHADTQNTTVTASVLNVWYVLFHNWKRKRDIRGRNKKQPWLFFKSVTLQKTLYFNYLSVCFLSPVKDSCQKPACYEKTVSLNKEPHDSLGMTVAGGMSSRGWDLPIYVTNVDPDGVVGQEGSIRKGKMSCHLIM